MVRPLLVSTLVALLPGAVSPAWCSDGIFRNTPTSHRSAGFSTLQTVDPTFVQAERVRTTFTSHVQYPSVVSPRFRDLTPEAVRPQIEHLQAMTTWFEGKLATEAEIAYSPTGMTWPMSPIVPTRTDGSARMFRIGLIASEGSLRYGVTFRQAGRGFLLSPDRATREVWGEWKNGWVTFRNAVGQTWNNVEAEITRSRLEQTYGRVGLILNKPLWPEFSITYARNSLNSLLDPIGVTSQRSSNHTIEGAVVLQRPGWDIRFASSYILANDFLRGNADSSIRVQTLSAILRPISTLTISPVLAYRQEFQSWSGVRIDNPTASLAFSYQRNPQLHFSAMGNYSSFYSSDGLIHNENLRWRGVVDWTAYSSAEWATKVGVEAGYNRVTNRVAHSADIEDISGLVRLGIVAR
ncbi:MAG: hypothetical protein A4E19_06930 [Nitrospira sp. SG-bin1]|nr:MAG: hypothetical protein A4E19_06930 [Nitrospira sp. SG-bin1]